MPPIPTLASLSVADSAFLFWLLPVCFEEVSYISEKNYEYRKSGVLLLGSLLYTMTKNSGESDSLPPIFRMCPIQQAAALHTPHLQQAFAGT